MPKMVGVKNNTPDTGYFSCLFILVPFVKLWNTKIKLACSFWWLFLQWW